MSVLYVPRSTWFLGAPTNNSGTPRPRLAPLRPQMTRHYTGSPPASRNATWAAKDWMPWFQTVALASGKSYEYNYVIPPRADGSAQVWEYAGGYQAAHSAGENDISVGVLFAIGVANHPSFDKYDPTKPTVWEPLTDEMVDAYRWLRDEHLKPLGIVAPSVAEIEHRHMPGAATDCPGQSVIFRDVDLDAPYQPEDWTMRPKPGRPLDTRETGNPFKRGETRTVPIDMASEAILRIQVVNPHEAGWLSLDGGNTVAVNFWPGQPVAAGTVYTGLDVGRIHILATAACDVIVDVQGVG